MNSYKSKVDWWLGLILFLRPVVTIGVLVKLISEGGDGIWIGVLPVVFVALLYGGLIFPMRYILMEDHLLIRSGFVKQRIPYADMESVEPSRNLISSPALSLDRIQIMTKNSGFGQRVSPKGKLEFMSELATKTPHLEISGDSLLPPTGKTDS